MQLHLHPLTLRLKEPFTISRGSYAERKALIVELAAGGKCGYGEASEHAYYGVTQPALVARAEELRPLIESYPFDNPQNFHAFLAPHLRASSFLQCALDNAAHDLYGKLQGKPCHEIWGMSAKNLPPTSFTISIDRLEKMVEKVKSTHFAIYKIKLGTEQDLQIVKAIRQHTDALLRVDANCAWTARETIRNSFELKSLGVEFIEQPLPAEDWQGMQEVFEKSALPILADEACRREEDLQKCADVFSGINIKLMKCGGLTPALRMINNARRLGLKVMCGCMVESSVGISAIAQLLPALDYVDMDGPLLLHEDPAAGVRLLPDGTVVLPREPGLGVSLKLKL